MQGNVHNIKAEIRAIQGRHNVFLMISAPYDPMAYAKLKVWAARCRGMTDKSATRMFEVPYTLRLLSTTPPFSWGSIDKLPMVFFDEVS